MTKDIQQKLAKFAQILGIPNNTLQRTLVQKFSGIKVNNALVLPILLYEAKFGPIEKRTKNKRHS
jgi:hypothetical protein